jgi:NADH:ubiquinone oxidoreductase subunit 5 (subunit L)/multisubunit Na+/H+ antiporter MnhA subunit
MHGLYKFLENRWYINAVYYKAFVDAPVQFAQWTTDTVEDKVLSKINIGGVIAGIDLSKAGNWVDRIVNAISGGFATVGEWLSRGARKMQTGILEQYTLIFTVGLLLILVVFLLALGVKFP